MSQVNWHLLSDKEKDEEYFPVSYKPYTDTIAKRRIYALAALLLVSLGLNISFYIQQWRLDLDQVCTKHSTLHGTPIMDNKPMSYSTIKFDGSVFYEDIYRQAPSPEVDQAWEELGIHYRPQVIPEDKALEAGLSLKNAKRRKSDGGGFLVTVEGLHQLHCLNVLRTNLWFNYEYYRDRKIGVWNNTLPAERLHVGHCVNVLRQALMCAADVSLLGQVWVNKERPHVFSFSGTEHKCRDFSMVREWAENNQVKEGDMAEYEEGDITLSKYP